MCLCSIELILETIGKKWSMAVIDEIAQHKKIRYNDLQSKLPGISPSMLASVLKNLESIELVNRKSYNEIPPKVEYSLTKKGKEFRQLVTPLIEWASKNGSTCDHETVNKIVELKNKSLNKLIEAAMCACMCMPMMVGFLFVKNPFW